MSEQTKLKLIKDKIYYSLTFNDLIFLKKYISKHGYNDVSRKILNFDSVLLINRLNNR